MQSIDLYGTINTCVCTLDSINHLTKIEDVAKTFDRVGLFMDDDGLFILMSTRCTSIKIFLRIIPLCMKTTAFSAYGKTLPKMITR